MLRGMTAAQFNRWLAWRDAQPRGEDRADVHTAFIATVQANANSKEPVEITDVMAALTDLWDPPTESEVAKRKEQKKARRRENARKKFVSMGGKGWRQISAR
jgi:hypothetical protein